MNISIISKVVLMMVLFGSAMGNEDDSMRIEDDSTRIAAVYNIVDSINLKWSYEFNRLDSERVEVENEFWLAKKSLVENIAELRDSLQNSLTSTQAIVDSVYRINFGEMEDNVAKSVGISYSSVGNTLGFMSLLIVIMSFMIGLLGLGGFGYLKKVISNYKKTYENELAKKSDEFDISMAVINAQFHITRRNYLSAKVEYTHILSLDPDHFISHERLGFLYQGDILDNPEKSVFHCKRAIEIKPNRILSYFNLQIALDHGKYPFDQYKAAYGKVIELATIQKAGNLILGKAKLFYADMLMKLPKPLSEEAVLVYKEAIRHFELISDDQATEEKDRWLRQAREGLDKI